ncbi:type II secretion system F family protein [Clostridium kluyveri]|uniref:Type II secretion system protein GspF domain-containing protein n=1 Tax=Clostridium kluyveri TaxID=1534 RepID=A0A1L5F647_CLOKL|nr:type II secretion system F family protein [Clostridium kluyveri]APM38491.1 hypothetical protein BS101_06930 [Clostridium kluyveri]UZQ50777.1 type II secretion system F family protein [Clostridium kluyveri]
MKKFICKFWNDEFEIIKEEMEEESASAVSDILKARGLRIIYVKEKFTLSRFGFLNRKFSEEMLANFCGQTAMILNSGVNLLSGLEIIQQQTKNQNMKKVILRIIESIKKGNNLAESMIACEKFPKLLIDMVMTGEVSGNVDTVLYNMESFYKREASMNSKIKNASLYPTLILVVAVGMMLFFNFFVYPEIRDLFTGENLPAVTIIVLAIMNFLNNNYLYIVAGTLIFIGVFKYICTIPKAAYFWGKVVLKIPVFGPVKEDVITSRFTRSMGIFLKSAVPIITIMENIKFIVDNQFIMKKIENAERELMTGTKFADSIENEKIFEPLVTQMIKVGEETGRLDEMMFKLADIYDEKVEIGITRLMSLVEPVLTLIIGIVVGVAILGMALPVMQITQGMQ